MVNYIRSEIYRSKYNRSIKITIVAFFALIFLFIGSVVTLMIKDANFPYDNTRYILSSIYMEMPVFMIVIMLLSSIIDDSECKNHTIKHSVAFGIHRDTIYLGRFFVQAVVCTVIYVVMAGLVTLLAYSFLEHSNVGELNALLRVSLGGYLCLIATLAVSYYFVMTTENQGVAMGLSVVVLIALPTACNLAGMRFTFLRKIYWIFPYNQLASDGPLVFPQGNSVDEIITALFVGLIWTVLFLGLGILRFRKKEVK